MRRKLQRKVFIVVGLREMVALEEKAKKEKEELNEKEKRKEKEKRGMTRNARQTSVEMIR